MPIFLLIRHKQFTPGDDGPQPRFESGASGVTLRDVSLYIQLTSQVSCSYVSLGGLDAPPRPPPPYYLFSVSTFSSMWQWQRSEPGAFSTRQMFRGSGSQLSPAADQLVQTFSDRMRGERRKAHDLHSKTGRWWKAPHGPEIHVRQMECFTYPSGNEASENVWKKRPIGKKNCDWMNSLDLWLEVLTVL